MWREIDVPACPAAICGYTHADCGVCFVATRSGLYLLRLTPEPERWLHVAHRIEEQMIFENQLITYDDAALFYQDVRFALHGFPMLDGVDHSDIPRVTHLNGQRLTYDMEDESAVVLLGDSEIQRIGVDGTEEWLTAGFSSDGRHLTIASLERIKIFELKP